MKFEEFLKLTQGLPLIEREHLLHQFSSRNALEVQLTRWVKQGRLVQIKRGVYLLAGPYRKIQPNEFSLSALLNKPSYISLEKALEYYDLIPEGVAVYTAVTAKKPCRWETELGVFNYQHIQRSLFWGYQAVTVSQQTGFIALPEKALLDLCYFRAGEPSRDFFEGLRLQNMEVINAERLQAFARRFEKPKMLRVAVEIGRVRDTLAAGEKTPSRKGLQKTL